MWRQGKRRVAYIWQGVEVCIRVTEMRNVDRMLLEVGSVKVLAFVTGETYSWLCSLIRML